MSVKLTGYKLPQTIDQIAEERDALAERCGRLEAALRSLRSMCADNLDLGAEGPAYWEDCGDVINEALDDRKGAAP